MYSESEIRERVLSFLEKYGDKGYLVLRTALDVSLDPEIDHRLGDFSYKHVVSRLRRIGVNYAPHNLLRVLEREYGLIEKTYISTTQKWWSFVDLEAVRRAILEYTGLSEASDPRLRLLIIKYRSIEPQSILATLRRLSVKPAFSTADKELFKRIVFNELESVAELLEEMMKYGDVLEEEIKVLNEILSLAEKISARISGLAFTRRAVRTEFARDMRATREDI
ncbi:MAG: hypothetical protein DRO13_03070 [Thermoprotei archaeon]|nr:MAG: hypothetical protein DRO13_03070 [Thermoprotei archaeon]